MFNSPHTSRDAQHPVLKLLRGVFEKCNGWLRRKLGCPHKSYIHQRTWDPRKKQLSYARTETLLDCGPPDPEGVQPRSKQRSALNTIYPFPLRIISYLGLHIETRSFQDKVGCHPNIDLHALINMTLPN